jgi:hypothetical protein
LEINSLECCRTALLKKVFNIDVDSRHSCGGKNVKIIAAVLEKKVIEKILTQVEIPNPAIL